MYRIVLISFILFSNLVFSQHFRQKVKYVDSIVAKKDTIFLIFTKEINFAQSKVPIYKYQIDKSKITAYKKIDYDTLQNGTIIYKKLPKIKSQKDVQLKNVKKHLTFENDFFTKLKTKRNKKLIGYENRICLNKSNRVFSNKCGADLGYDYIFYHAHIKPKYTLQYAQYVECRDEQIKSYTVRYSGNTPNVESGATQFIDVNIYDMGENKILFFIDDFYLNLSSEKNKQITISLLDSVLKKGKVYFLKTSQTMDGNHLLFEEVKYQRYITD